MTDARHEAAAAIASLGDKDGVLGAALLTRDGIVVSQRFRASCNIEAVCAMGAAIMGAADAALQDVSGQGAAAFVARAEGHAIAGEVLDDDYMLLVVARGGDAAVAAARTAAASLRGILQEA